MKVGNKFESANGALSEEIQRLATIYIYEI
jgi:hypothetical protein